MSQSSQVPAEFPSNSEVGGALRPGVEKGIPMPPPMKQRRVDKYPFERMEVGDSFLVRTLKDRKTTATSAWQFARSEAGRGKRFSSRKVTDGYRFWRVE